MAFSVITGFNFLPALAMEYASARFVEQLQLIAQATGIVKMMDVSAFGSNLNLGGEYLDMPYFVRTTSILTRRDLAAVAAPTDLDITGANQRGVILRRKLGPVKFTEDIFVRGLDRRNVEQEIGHQMADAAAKEVQQKLIMVTIAALTGSATHVIPSSWVTDGEKVVMTYEALQNMRMALGDNYNDIKYVVMHSDVFRDLIGDALANFKVDSVAGYTIVTGLPHALGQQIIVTDDPSLKGPIDGYTKYKTLAFGKEALACVFHRHLHIEAERRLDFEAPYWRILGNMDFAPHLMGTKYTSTANPTDGTFATTGNWSAAYNDHREVKAVTWEHNANFA